VTTPVPPPQQQAQPPPPQPGLDDPALVIAVAAILAGIAGPVITAVAVAAALKRFALGAAVLGALTAVLGMILEHPPPVTGTIGAASEQVQSMNAARRAQYATAAAKRVLVAEREARAKGEPVEAARKAALERERRWYEAHQKAMWQRAVAAGRIDMEAAVHGPILGWYSVLTDKRTTPECRAAHRHNFYVDNPPEIGLPGIVHVGCRCEPGPPWPGGKFLPGRGRGQALARPPGIGRIDLSWHDAWRAEARGDNGQWVSMTRGAYLGDDDPVKLAAVRRNPAAFIRTEGAGRHWTANGDVSRQYAMGSDEDKRPGRFGVIMHGTVHHTSILPPGHPDIDAGVWQGADSAEREYPLKAGVPVSVTHVTVAWRDKNGTPHTETHPVQMTVQTARAA
jgi:hypothetical protein